MSKNWKKYLVPAILGVVLVVCIIVIVVFYSKRSAGKDEYEQVQEIGHNVEEEPEPEPELEPEPEPEPEPDPYVSPINFEDLWKDVNEDIYAWIEVPGIDTYYSDMDGAKIDYPILQDDEDDSYYLNYTVEGTKGLPGSIYTEMQNSKDFTDFATVIYGHSMKNRTMFGGLHAFEDEEFFDKHQDINIYLPDKELKYKIFAAVLFDDRHLLNTADFSTEEGRQDFLDEILNDRDMINNYNSDVEVGPDDHIVILSTCTAAADTMRWLVCGVQVEDSSNPDASTGDSTADDNGTSGNSAGNALDDDEDADTSGSGTGNASDDDEDADTSSNGAGNASDDEEDADAADDNADDESNDDSAAVSDGDAGIVAEAGAATYDIWNVADVPEGFEELAA